LTQTDPSGTLTSTRDARNRLAALSGRGLSAGFAYDGLGRRVLKTVNSKTTTVRYDRVDAIRESGLGGDTCYLRALRIDEVLVYAEAVSRLSGFADCVRMQIRTATGRMV